MTDKASLEKYFSVLIHEKEEFIDSPYRDKTKRYGLFDSIRGDFNKIGDNMGLMVPNLQQAYATFVPLTQNIGKCFHNMAHLSNDELDYYIRTLAVERLIYKLSSAGNLTPEMLKYLIEGLMALLFEDGDEIMKIARKTLVSLKQDQDKKGIKKKEEEQLRGQVVETLEVYEGVEQELAMAKQGIIAQDKKMLEVLRQLKIGMGKSIITQAIETSSLLSPRQKATGFISNILQSAKAKKKTEEINKAVQQSQQAKQAQIQAKGASTPQTPAAAKPHATPHVPTQGGDKGGVGR